MADPSDSSNKRLPRNAGPIPFPPNRHDTMSPPFEDFIGSIPTASPSVYSDFNVVLDDGTLQKRTVSLSTLPDDLNLFALEDEDNNNDEEEDKEEVIDIKRYDIPVQGLRKAR